MGNLAGKEGLPEKILELEAHSIAIIVTPHLHRKLEFERPLSCVKGSICPAEPRTRHSTASPPPAPHGTAFHNQRGLVDVPMASYV